MWSVGDAEDEAMRQQDMIGFNELVRGTRKSAICYVSYHNLPFEKFHLYCEIEFKLFQLNYKELVLFSLSLTKHIYQYKNFDYAQYLSNNVYI